MGHVYMMVSIIWTDGSTRAGIHQVRKWATLWLVDSAYVSWTAAATPVRPSPFVSPYPWVPLGPPIRWPPHRLCRGPSVFHSVRRELPNNYFCSCRASPMSSIAEATLEPVEGPAPVSWSNLIDMVSIPSSWKELTF